MGGVAGAAAKAGAAHRSQGIVGADASRLWRGGLLVALLLLIPGPPAGAQNWYREIQPAPGDAWNQDDIDHRAEIGAALLDDVPSATDSRMNFDSAYQYLGVRNLVLSDFYHRGNSFTWGEVDDDFAVTAFSLHSGPTAGFDALAERPESRNRVQGVTLNARPVESLSRNISITGTFYKGETNGAASGSGLIGSDSDGSGGSVAVDTRWLDQRLSLRGEVAASRFAFDRTQDEAAESDLAYALLGSFALVPETDFNGTRASWHVGLERKRVGTRYASIANPTVVADRETTLAFTNFSWGRVNGRAEAGYETNNVERQEDRPIDRRMFATFSTAYTPEVTPDSDGSYGWLGRPTFGLQMNLSDGRQIERPDPALPESGSYRAMALTASAATSYHHWGWNLSHTLESRADRTAAAADTAKQVTHLGLRFHTAPGVTVSPYARSNLFDNRQGPQNLDGVDLGLDFTAALIPDDLTGKINLSMSPRGDSSDAPSSYLAGGELSWNAIAPRTDRSGLALALAGNYRHAEQADPALAEDEGQIFGRVKLLLPLAD